MPQVPGAPYDPASGVAPQERPLRIVGIPDVPDAFGLGVARAITAFGGDVATGAEEVGRRAQGIAQMRIEGVSRDITTEAMNNVEKIKNDFRAKQGYAAADPNAAFAQAEQERLNGRAKALAAGGDYGAKLFDDQFASMQRSVIRDIGGHSATEFASAQKQSLTNAAAASKNVVGSTPWDDGVWQTQRQAAIDRERTSGGLSQIPQDEVAFNQKNAVSDLALDRVRGAALSDKGTMAAYNLLQALKNDKFNADGTSSLSNPDDVAKAEKIVRDKFNVASTAAIASKEQDLQDEVKAYGYDTPRALRLQGEIGLLRQYRVALGEPQEESDLADKKLQGQVGAGKAEYRVNSVLQGTSQFQGMIDTSAARHGLDPVMLARQLHQESGLDPNVKDSSAGAQGIAQFMPDTARRFGVNVRSPASSIEGAATYMDWLLQQPYIRGNVGLALAGYNWGEGNVQAWAAGGFNPRQGPPKETRDYVKAITGQTISDWLGGTRPDWMELGYPQTVGNARQQAVALTQQEMTRTDIPVSQRNLNVAAMDKAIKLSDENNIKLANLREQSQKQADDTFLDQVLKNQTSETEKRVTVQDVEQMPGSAQGGPSFAAKERAIKLINQSDMPEVPKAVSDSNTLDYFRRINLPPGDPNRIVNRSTLQDALGDRQFTREAYDWLAKKLEDARTPGGEHLAQLRGQFFAAATAAIDKSNPIRGITDPDAKLRAYAFERMVDAKMDAARAENKDPAVYITPGTAEYLGKPEILAPYQKTMQQQLQDMRARMQRPQQPGSTIPPVVPPARAEPSALPPHNPGESPADYMRRIGAGP